MGVQQSTTLNTDQDDKLTSGEYGDAGDGTSRWYQWKRTDDGGNVAVGSTDDTADTATDATPGTVIGLLKGIISTLAAGVTTVVNGEADEDDAHTTGDTGVPILAVRRDTAAVGSDTDGDYSTVNVDGSGRVRTLAKRDPDDDLSITAASAEVADLVVKASAGTLHSIVGYIASNQDGWIQVHDATSAPADTAVPELSFFVAAASAAVGVNIPLPGHVCATGITLSWSTTGPTLTSGGTNMMVAGYYE